MTKPRWQWLQRDRRAFCEVLARTGDPVTAAAAVGHDLGDAYRQRETVPGFEADWQKALSVAWDNVETMVLANLLAQARADAEKPVRLIDSRMALAVLQRREGVKVTRGSRPDVRPDMGRVAAMRDEIRALGAGR
ncbi:hypothetical protein GCM10011529_00980 [Polymorphobacter glacialis]|uniref:Terminase n=1 Tax=Sandarakinorhabdus glacialis TaxID=1614636 RepID=A0A916ZHV8_9SPHN|nr:hypothetical protein [Polymorphobacter glacialis]GGD98715.1 hypothetical protein GCM10011529_00980 [Polymorphobacter glacialis]